MADNPTFTTTVATLPSGTVAGLMQEATTGALVPRGVSVFQTGGSTGAWTFTLAASGAGAVSGGVQRMTLASDDPAVTSLAILDDWDESDRAKVNLVVGQAGITAGAGAVGASTPRVTLASDDPAVTALQILDNAISGSEMQVDVVGALPTGSNVIGAVTQSGTWTVQPGNTANTTAWLVTGTGGTFPATQSGTWTVGTELPDPAALADNTANPTITSVGTFPHWYDGATWDRAAGTAADGLLVNLGANNDVTVTGSVTANAGTNLNTSALALEAGGNLAGAATSLAILDDWDETDRCKVNPIVGQAGVAAGAGAVGATVQRVTLASDDPGVASLSVLDDWDDGSDRCRVVGAAAEDAVLAGNPVRQGIRASAAVPTAMSADGDAVTPWADLSGRQVVKQQSGTATTSQVADNAASTTLLAANTARLGASIQNDSSAVLYLKCGTTASATDYTARLVQYSYWEAPYGYTGRIDGIWSSDPNDGGARVTEYT